jgi:putative membrane protein
MNTKYLKSLAILPCLALMLAQAATAADSSDADRGQLSASDYKFAKKAAVGGMFEVTLGNIAQGNSSNNAVQQFGQHMVADHGKAGQALTQLASTKGAVLPTQLPEKFQKEVDHLSSLNGPDFDKAYITLMVKAHKADEKLFKSASEDVQDADLKAFAANTLTIVQEHLKMAEDLENNVKHSLSMNNQ